MSTDVWVEMQVLGVDCRVTIRTGDEELGTYLEASLQDTTLGDVLRGIVHLADPNFDLVFPPPWNKLLDIDLSRLVFLLSSKKGVGIRVKDLGIKLPFLELRGVTIWHPRKGDGSDAGSDQKSVILTLDCKILGQESDSIKWDVLNEPEPPVSTASHMFKLHFLGLGHRVALPEPVDTVAGVIEQLQEFGEDGDRSLGGLRFDPHSHWLFGVKLEALKMLSLSAVFNDPDVYGLLLSLSGEKAKQFGGLSFEILYRKVAENLGVYHAELKLPDAVRKFDAGQVSITLPVVAVDIYTDGGFYIDLGFPRNGDFTRSFALEVFPFTGAGGLYFGVLNERAAVDVPVAQNGTFSPVVVCGLGLQVGLGKQIALGVLRAGFTIGVEGIIEGAFAVFRETENPDQTAVFYRVSGSIRLVGHLYGAVDFAIVKARVDIFVYASAQLVLECYRKANVTLAAGVRVDLRVKIIFVKLHFHFSAHVRESITIGSDTPPPWQLEPSAKVRLQATPMVAAARAGPLAWTAPRFDKSRARPEVPLYFIPQATMGVVADDPDGSANGDTVEPKLVAMLFIGTGLDEKKGQKGPIPFVEFTRALFRWAVDVARKRRLPSEDDRSVQRKDLEAIRDDLSRPHGANGQEPSRFDAAAIVGFLDDSLIYPVQHFPEGLDIPVTVFPMLPGRWIRVKEKAQEPREWWFDECRKCDPSYRDRITDYFQQTAPESYETATEGEADDGGREPLTELVLVDYCRMILRQIVGDALQWMDSRVEHDVQERETVQDIVKAFGLDPVHGPVELARANRDRTLEGPIEIPVCTTQVLPEDSLESFAARYPGLDPLTLYDRLQDQPGILRPSPPGDPLRYECDAWVEDPSKGVEQVSLHAEIHEGTTFLNLVEELEHAANREKRRLEDDHPNVEIGLQFDVESLKGWLCTKTKLLRAGVFLEIPSFQYAPKRAPDGWDLSTPQQFEDAFGFDPVAFLEANFQRYRTILVPSCKKAHLDILVAALEKSGAFLRPAGAVSRFLLHGLRLPDPGVSAEGATGLTQPIRTVQDVEERPHYPLYALTGQEWSVPTDLEGYEIRLGSGSTPIGGSADLTEAGRLISQWTSKAPGVPLFGDGIKQLVPTALCRSVPRSYSLGSPVPWRTRESKGAPPLDLGRIYAFSEPLRRQIDGTLDTLDGSLPEPVPIRLKTFEGSDAADARQEASAVPATRLEFLIRQVRDPQNPERALPTVIEVVSSVEVGRDDLLALLRFVRQNAKPDGEPVRHRIDLLFTPNPNEDVGEGLQSDRFAEDSCPRLLKTNLSTVSHQPVRAVRLMAVPGDREELSVADTNQPAQFLQLLWECSVVNRGGFLLHYRTGDGRGLPPSMFTGDPLARLTILVRLAGADHGVQSFHNCWVVSGPPPGDPTLHVEAATHQVKTVTEGDKTPERTFAGVAAQYGVDATRLAGANVSEPGVLAEGATIPFASSGVAGAADTKDYTVLPEDTLLDVANAKGLPLETVTAAAVNAGDLLQVGASLHIYADWVSRRSLVRPGNVGLRMVRKAPSDDGAEDHLAGLYNLLDVRVCESPAFRQGPEPLPLGPTTPEKAGGEAPEAPDAWWLYRGVFPAAPLFRARTREKSSGESTDPYAGIGEELILGLQYRDLFGNRLPDTMALAPLRTTLRYRDPLIGLNAWKGTAASYRFMPSPDGSTATVRLHLEYGPPAAPTSNEKPDVVAERARADRERYEALLRQIERPEVRFTLTTSLDQGQSLPLDKTRILEFARSIHQFLECRESGTNGARVEDLWLEVPVALDLADLIVPVTVELLIERDAALVDPAFVDEPGVQSSRTSVMPDLGAADAERSGLRDFAADFEAAFPELKLATGTAPASAGVRGPRGRLLAVQYQSEKLGVSFRSAPFFYALAPLATEPWSGTVEVRDYSGESGLSPDAHERTFTEEDLDSWRRDLLETVDRVLSSESAMAAWRADRDSLEKLVRHKRDLADAMRGSVSEVLASASREGFARRDRAGEAVYEGLLERLGSAYEVDAVVQFIADVKLQASEQRSGLRLVGQPLHEDYEVREGATLRSIAGDLGVTVGALAAALDPVQHDVLAALVTALDKPDGTLEPEIAEHVDQLDRLAPGTRITSVRRELSASASDTMRTALAYLAPGVRMLGGGKEPAPALRQAARRFALSNADVEGLFPAGTMIEVDLEQARCRYRIRRSDSLRDIAHGLRLPPTATLSDLVLALVNEPLGTPLRRGVRMSFLTMEPAIALTEAKLDLVGLPDGESPLTFLVRVSGDREHSHVRLRLQYRITGMEYDIEMPSIGGTYRSSKWLNFILPAEPMSLGTVDVPIPVRTHPAPPVVLNEDRLQRLPEHPRLVDLKRYHYFLTYSAPRAAQDEVEITVRSGDGPAAGAGASESLANRLGSVLAGYAYVSPALKGDLALLGSLPDPVGESAEAKAARNALRVLESLVAEVINAWSTPEVKEAQYRIGKPRLRAPERVLRMRQELAAWCVADATDGGVQPTARLLSGAPETPKGGPPEPNRFTVELGGFDAVADQSVRGSIQVVSNRRLVAGRETSPAFIYRSHPVTKGEKPLVPSFSHSDPIDVCSLRPIRGYETPTLRNRLITLFSRLLGIRPDRAPPREVKVQVRTRYSYDIARGGGGPPARSGALTVEVPWRLSLERPVRGFDSEEPFSLKAFCEELANELGHWMDEHRPAGEGASWLFDVVVCSAGSARLLRLENLKLSLAATLVERGRSSESSAEA